VENVSWFDAIVFCNKLSMQEGLSPAYRINESTDPADWGKPEHSYSNPIWNAVQIVDGSTGYRLPTEAQWEYACRAGTTTAYNTGDTISSNTGWFVDWDYDDVDAWRNCTTHEVGLKSPNAWSLYDMHGNVMEWCWDLYGAYASGAQTDPAGPNLNDYFMRVMRGGAFNEGGEFLRSARRYYDVPITYDDSTGFRVVRP
jgi:formylglycine-generating enzyme required for sulfatase activity